MKPYLELYLRERDLVVNALRRFLHQTETKIRFDNSVEERLTLVFRTECDRRKLQSFHNWFVDRAFSPIVGGEYSKELDSTSELRVTLTSQRIEFKRAQKAHPAVVSSKIRVTASSRLTVLRNYLQPLGIKFVKVFLDAPDMIGAYTSSITARGAVKICKAILKANPGSEFLDKLVAHDWRDSPWVGVKFSNGDSIEIYLDEGERRQRVIVHLVERLPEAAPRLSLPRFKPDKIKIRNFNKFWDTRTEGEERPLLANWPDYVWHLTNASNANELLTNGKIGGELYFAFASELAMSYNRFGSAAILLRIPTKVLTAKYIGFDFNTGGESFAYYGKISSKSFEGFSL